MLTTTLHMQARHPGSSACYTVSVPVDRIRADLDDMALSARDDHELSQDLGGASLRELRWDENDPDSDPSSRFPCGA